MYFANYLALYNDLNSKISSTYACFETFSIGTDANFGKSELPGRVSPWGYIILGHFLPCLLLCSWHDVARSPLPHTPTTMISCQQDGNKWSWTENSESMSQNKALLINTYYLNRNFEHWVTSVSSFSFHVSSSTFLTFVCECVEPAFVPSKIFILIHCIPYACERRLVSKP